MEFYGGKAAIHTCARTHTPGLGLSWGETGCSGGTWRTSYLPVFCFVLRIVGHRWF